MCPAQTARIGITARSGQCPYPRQRPRELRHALHRPQTSENRECISQPSSPGLRLWKGIAVKISPHVRLCNAHAQRTSYYIGRVAMGQELCHAVKPAFSPDLLHRTGAKLLGLLTAFRVVEVLILSLVGGRFDPVLGKKPCVPNNGVARLQLFGCYARSVSRCVIQATQLAAPGEREPVNPVTESALALSSASEPAQVSIKSQTLT